MTHVLREKAPSSYSFFASRSFWDDFFIKKGEPFEWYGEYKDLAPILHQYIKPADDILMVGCGSSVLSEEMYDASLQKITNIDISPVAISKMAARNATRRPLMKFLVEDATKMSFGDESFSAVVDKGTLDALAYDSAPATVEHVEAMFSEVMRTLKPMGKYVCVSLAQDHVIKMFGDYFAKRCAIVRIYRYNIEDSEKPVFTMVVTKLKEMPGLETVFQTVFDNKKPNRCEGGLEEFLMTVRNSQDVHRLGQSFTKGMGIDCETALHVPDNPVARYHMRVVNRLGPKGTTKGSKSKAAGPKFAIFVVPLGRDVEWLFSTKEGGLKLLESTSYDRLVVVALSRSHVYESIVQVKDELSQKVMELAPDGITEESEVPFLSCCENYIGTRQCLYEGTWGGGPDQQGNEGACLVEQVDVDGQLVRQALFTQGSICHWERCSLKTVRSKKGSHTALDLTQLHSHHHAALKALSTMGTSTKSPTSVLILGMKAGVLPRYLHNTFRKMNITVVERNAESIELAKDWFECSPSKRLTVTLEEPLAFVDRQAAAGGVNGTPYDAVIINEPFVKEGTADPQSSSSYFNKGFLSRLKSLMSHRAAFIYVFPKQFTDGSDSQTVAKFVGAMRVAFPHACCSYGQSGSPTVIASTTQPMFDGIDALAWLTSNVKDVTSAAIAASANTDVSREFGFVPA